MTISDKEFKQLKSEVTALSEKVDAVLERGLWRWFRRNWKAALLLVPLLALISAWVIGWWLPDHRKFLEAYENSRMDARIDAR